MLNIDDINRIPLEERVDNGIRWLNENFPGWENRINLKSLSLKNAERCICGQVFRKEGKDKNTAGHNGYHYAYHHLFNEANSWISAMIPNSARKRFLVSGLLGFSSLNGNEAATNKEFAELTKIWKRRIQEILNG